MTSQTDPALTMEASNPEPPVAQKTPKTDVVHGETRIDDYFWLRDKENPEVARYLEAENAYADSLTRHTSALQEQLYREMVSHIKETDIGVPFREGDYFYYTRTETGKQYPIFCRKRAAKDAPDGNASEEIILDQNALAEGQKFMSLGGMSVSEDGNLLAYSTDNTGFREYTLYVKNLQTGELSSRVYGENRIFCLGRGQSNSLLHSGRGRYEAPLSRVPARSGDQSERRRRRL